MLSEIWETMKGYIPTKDRQLAADHLMNLLVDSGVEDIVLQEFSQIDAYIENAYDEYVDQAADTEELDDSYE